jgi:hypothetical protein
MARCTATRRFKGWTGEIRCDLEDHDGRMHINELNGLRWFEGKVAKKQRLAFDRRMKERMEAINEARSKGESVFARLKQVIRAQRMKK